MTEQQIEWLSSLDPHKMDGTIQFFLMESTMRAKPFEEVATMIINQLYKEKKFLSNEVTLLSREVNKLRKEG